MRRKLSAILVVALLIGLSAQTALAGTGIWSTNFDFREHRDNPPTFTTIYQLHQGWARTAVVDLNTGIRMDNFNLNRSGRSTANLRVPSGNHSHGHAGSATPW